jgi:hypothetical protein
MRTPLTNWSRHVKNLFGTPRAVAAGAINADAEGYGLNNPRAAPRGPPIPCPGIFF